MKRGPFASFTKNTTKLSLAAAGTSCSLISGGLLAQEALRESWVGERSALARHQRTEEQHYNLKLGQLGLKIDASLESEFNDNVNVSGTVPQRDVVLRPHLDLRSHWQVTEKNALDMGVGLAYSRYFDHPRYSRFLITPDSEFSFDVFLSDYQVNFHDRASYTQNAIEVGSVSGDQASAQHTALYGGFSNTAGVDVGRSWGRMSFTVGYDHSIFQASSSYWARQDKSAELFFGRGRFALNEVIALGLEASGSVNNYAQQILNDSTSYSAGIFSNWKVSSKIQATARVGYAAYSFDSTAQIGKTRDVNSVYGDISIQHVMNQYLNHAIVGSRENRLGLYSDAVSVYSLHYNLNLAIIRDLPLATQIFYEQGRDNRLTSAESYDRVGLTIDASYRLTRKSAVKLGYRLLTKDSSVRDRDYQQNAVFFTWFYRF